MISSLSELASASSLVLPTLLLQIETDERSVYPDVMTWRHEWKLRTLAAQPVLSCIYDFEWLAPDAASEVLAGWLSPRFQNGRRFLPFAQTGAGDAYCLTPIGNGSLGIAIVWHDREKSQVTAASFDDFVYESLVLSAVDFSDLIDDGFTRDEAMQCVVANISYVKPFLSEGHQIGLEHILHSAELEATAEGMISENVGHAALARLPQLEEPTFVVVPRWECE